MCGDTGGAGGQRGGAAGALARREVVADNEAGRVRARPEPQEEIPREEDFPAPTDFPAPDEFPAVEFGA